MGSRTLPSPAETGTTTCSRPTSELGQVDETSRTLGALMTRAAPPHSHAGTTQPSRSPPGAANSHPCSRTTSSASATPRARRRTHRRRLRGGRPDVARTAERRARACGSPRASAHAGRSRARERAPRISSLVAGWCRRRTLGGGPRAPRPHVERLDASRRARERGGHQGAVRPDARVGSAAAHLCLDSS